MAQWLDRSRSRSRAVCRRNSRRAGGDHGFTLVEVLIAMSIMTVGLVAVAQLMAVSAQSHRLGRMTSDGARLAAAKIEELVKLNMSSHPSVQITPASPNSLAQNVTNFWDMSGQYTRRWQLSAGPTANTRRLTVRVVPPVGLPLAKNVEVTTILRRW